MTEHLQRLQIFEAGEERLALVTYISYMAKEQKPPVEHAPSGAAPTPAKEKDFDEDMGTMPPKEDEGLDPQTAANKAAEDSKSEEDKQLEAAANARNAVGGQGGGIGSEAPAHYADKKTVTHSELEKSKQPNAPEHPLEVPDAVKIDEK